MTNATNLIELLERDHKKVEALFGRLDATPAEQLGDYFCQLREELVRHEVAEELVLYPAFREHVEGGDAIADACIAEQSEAEETLASLEKQDTDTSAFRAQLVELRSAVIAHARHEETEIFPALAHHTDATKLGALGDRYEKALSSAPTHPHPHAPDTPPGNLALGPIAALIDRVRDSMRHAA